MSQPRRDAWKQLVHRSLHVQLRIFLIIFLVTIVITIERIIANEVNPLWALLGLVIGIVIGLLLARTRPLRWDQTKQQVVATSNLLGLIAIVIYLVFIVEKSDIVSAWIDDAHIVGVVGMAITSGVMYGRTRAMFQGIRGVLRSADLTPDEDKRD